MTSQAVTAIDLLVPF